MLLEITLTIINSYIYYFSFHWYYSIYDINYYVFNFADAIVASKLPFKTFRELLELDITQSDASAYSNVNECYLAIKFARWRNKIKNARCKN